MECPYCAEDIKDKAVVCRYCGRDLSLVRENQQLRERVSSLEKQNLELSTAPRAAQENEVVADRLVAGRPGFTQTNRWLIVFAWCLGWSIPGWMTDLVMIWRQDGSDVFDSHFLFVSGVLSIFLGALASFAWPGRHLKGYILLSMSLGPTFVVSEIVVYSLVVYFDPSTTLTREFYVTILVFGFGQSATFLSGTLFADLWKRKFLPHEISASRFARRVAEKVTNSDKEAYDLAIRLTQAFAPIAAAIIALVGTIATITAS